MLIQQRIIGAGVLIAGIFLLLNDSFFLGIILIILGSAFIAGASHDSWFHFEFGSDGTSDGGGDGGGGGGD